MKMKNKIILNSIQCNECKEILISRYRHDFVMCSCEAVSTDGGTDYLRRGFKEEGSYKDLSVWDTASFETIRESLYRGGYGKSGREKLKYVLLKDMSNEWLDNVCIYNIENNREQDNYYYLKELVYRKENGIYIED